MATSLKGAPASVGIAEGIVRIIDRYSNDAVEFNDGDILVTEMTEPAMIQLMNKAAGIITDVGGITCHAAIVSRELGIPCVIATNTATKTLVDGMRVRLDGGTGVVEIL